MNKKHKPTPFLAEMAERKTDKAQRVRPNVYNKPYTDGCRAEGSRECNPSLTDGAQTKKTGKSIVKLLGYKLVHIVTYTPTLHNNELQFYMGI